MVNKLYWEGEFLKRSPSAVFLALVILCSRWTSPKMRQHKYSPSTSHDFVPVTPTSATFRRSDVMIRRRIFYVLCAVCLFILFQNGLPSTTLTTNITYTIKNTIPPVNHRHGGSRSRVECPKSHACLPKARYLSPSELLDRPYPPDIPYNSTIPKLIHQSWSTTTLPIKYQKWSDTWRVNHPDWEWVLWTDEDNQALVDKYFPWMKETYERLPMINKVDLSRNMYMYVFGGYYFPLFLCWWFVSMLRAEFMPIWMLNVYGHLEIYSQSIFQSRWHCRPPAKKALSCLLSTRMPISVKWVQIQTIGTPSLTPGWHPLPHTPSFSSPCKPSTTVSIIHNSRIGSKD